MSARSNHRHVSATHVSIFRVMRIRISLQIMCRNESAVKKSYDILLNLQLNVYHIEEYRIFEGDEHVYWEQCCAVKHIEDTYSAMTVQTAKWTTVHLFTVQFISSLWNLDVSLCVPSVCFLPQHYTPRVSLLSPNILYSAILFSFKKTNKSTWEM